MRTVKAIELLNYLRTYGDDIELVGDADTLITGISSLKNYKENSLTWMKERTQDNIKQRINAIVLLNGIDINATVKFYSTNPKFFFFKAAEFLMNEEKKAGIMSTAIISKSADLGLGVSVGHYSCIGENVKIGKNTLIENHVVIGDNTIIGNDCIIKSGAIIGGRGFGYSKEDGEYYPVPHFGRVIIGNFVDIGSNTCIDRGTIDDTVIGDGVKIDNLCHIAHNVVIGKNCCIIANASIAGSVQIGEGSYIAINASILNQKKIGNAALIGVGAVVTNDIPQNAVCAFSPARVIRERTKEDRDKY